MLRTTLLSTPATPEVIEFTIELSRLWFDIMAHSKTAVDLGNVGLNITNLARHVTGPVLDRRDLAMAQEVHVGLLASKSPGDEAALTRYQVRRIDLLYVTLPSFKEESPEIDVGGVTMLLAGIAGRRIVMSHPGHIRRVLNAIKERGYMNGGEMRDSFLTRLASDATQTIAEYNRQLTEYLAGLAIDQAETE